MPPKAPRLSRRSLLGGGAAAAGVAGAFVAGRVSEGATDVPAARAAAYAFRGAHQAGIVTPAQDRLHFAAFDVTTTDRDALVELLKR
jgi:deferrochelatase/peroxidase EfeB